MIIGMNIINFFPIVIQIHLGSTILLRDCFLLFLYAVHTVIAISYLLTQLIYVIPLVLREARYMLLRALIAFQVI